jgi:hypothetical protein
MLASMKWLTPLFKAALAAPPLPLKDLLEEAARTTHLVFMTDSGRRSRFAALTVLNDILALDVCTDIYAAAHPTRPRYLRCELGFAATEQLPSSTIR